LQLRELADHVGEQVSFGQARCGVGLLGQQVTAQLLADGFGY
jgi:hypothetical protein